MLQLKNITKDYMLAGKPFPALKGIDLSFKENEFVSILGPSGCGKTTLLNIIGGLDRYTSGDLLIEGKSTKDFKDQDWDAYRNATIGFVFQSYFLLPRLTAMQNVAMPLLYQNYSYSESYEKAQKMLEKLGVGDLANHKPTELSGGQQQRVAVSRALVGDPALILADEPTGALDHDTTEELMKIFLELSQEGKSILMITHDVDLSERCGRRVRIRDGKIFENEE